MSLCVICGHECHCSNGGSCCGGNCSCGNCEHEIKSDLKKDTEKSTVEFEPDFNLTIH